MPRQALAKHDLPRVIHPHRVKHVLCEIDPEDGHLLLHGTHLLWLNGFPNLLELIVAHCRRSAQGRVHFITTSPRLNRPSTTPRPGLAYRAWTLAYMRSCDTGGQP